MRCALRGVVAVTSATLESTCSVALPISLAESVATLRASFTLFSRLLKSALDTSAEIVRPAIEIPVPAVYELDTAPEPVEEPRSAVPDEEVLLAVPPTL